MSCLIEDDSAILLTVNNFKHYYDRILEKKFFVLKTISTRTDFPKDMNDDERTIMENHVKYWTEIADKGKALIFGPVFEPEGTYGLGILCIKKEEEINILLEKDPAILSGLLNTNVFPMRAVLSKYWKFDKKNEHE